MTKMQLSAILVIAVCCLMTQQTTALIHVVGGKNGWRIPPNKTFFEEWAKPRVFGVGNKLFFPFTTAFHNIVEVGSQDDFDKCTENNLITMYTIGPLTLPLTRTGDFYFFSGVGTQCQLGLKLHIKVVPEPGSTGRKLAEFE